jgi:predicted Zn-dependent protease
LLGELIAMMHARAGRKPVVATLVTMAMLSAATEARAINLFSVEQEVQVGRQAAADAERQLPMLRDQSVQSYVTAIVRTLAAQAPGPRFPYQVKVVNAADLNAFALPGGFLYVNRGLIEGVRTEGELAGVLAHEIAHIALRHGTQQVTKSYGTQIGAGLLAQILGGRDGRLGAVEQILGNVGLSALLLKFSRNAENEADEVGARIMAQAGYDPMEMANFFDLLQAQKRRNPSGVEQFFSSHPSSANRSQHIRAEARELGGGRNRRVGNLSAVQARLDAMPAAPRARALRASGR